MLCFHLWPVVAYAGIPVVTVTSSQYKANYGDSVTLECNINANPPPTRCYWYKTANGFTTEISNGFPGTLGISLKTPSLTIKFATSTDTGRYNCIAQNAAGIGQSQSTNLEILAGKLQYLFNKLFGTRILCAMIRYHLVLFTLQNKSLS